MATHSSILAWIIPIDGGPWQATVYGVAKSGTQLSTSSLFILYIMVCLCQSQSSNLSLSSM